MREDPKDETPSGDRIDCDTNIGDRAPVIIYVSVRRQHNVRDHRAGTIDHPFQKHAQVRLRVHHIVMPRYSAMQTSAICHSRSVTK